MQEFKIRASAIGKIMPNGKGFLSKTTESYCQEWTKEQIYGKRKEFTSKYTEKGIIMEDTAIDMFSDYYDKGMLLKNDKYYESDYITGTPDIVLNDCVIDVKCSWDCFTFPLFDDDVPNKDYYWQLQGYMHLTGVDKAILTYVLIDTPANIIEREAYFHCKNNGYDDLDDDILKEFKDKMTYKSIDRKYLIKVFEIEKNNDDINAIIERVKECRNYIKTIKI